MLFNSKHYKVSVWSPEKGLPLTNVVIDTETTVAPFTDTPDLVLFQAYWGGDTAFLVKKEDIPVFLNHCQDKCLIFHNAAFDIDVICRFLNDSSFFHKWIDGGLIYDTVLMWKLIHLATEGYIPKKASLDYLMELFFNIELPKDEDIRLNFGKFLDSNIYDIPKDFVEYALKDVIATRLLFDRLHIELGTLGNHQQLTQPIQVAGALALNRIYKRGVSFNLAARADFLSAVDSNMAKLADKLATHGWARGIPGANEAYERAIKRLNIRLPKTDNGAISSKEEDLLPFREKHEFIKCYLDFHSLEKDSSFIRKISTPRVHPRYDILKNTGRTGCSSPNIQQLPRKGEIRGMFEAAPGHKFIITDYSAIELAALAQVTYTNLGHSKMRELINKGQDLHRYAASYIFEEDEDKITKEKRQFAKIPNFGFGANMSPKTFVGHAAKNGYDIDEKEAERIKTQWCKAFPEMKEYWNLKGEFGALFTHTTLTGRVRAKCSYTAYMNTGFQGLAADGAKIALYYLDYNNIPVVIFVHDEIVSEIKEENIEETLKLQEKIMIQGMQQVIPDVKISVESMVSDKYCK